MLTRFLISLIRFYQRGVSPLKPASCRYHPTCSHYARGAIEAHGPGRGLGLALRRILRCHPWGGMGYDPVPLPSGPEPRNDQSARGVGAKS